jgi:hypothetical protein
MEAVEAEPHAGAATGVPPGAITVSFIPSRADSMRLGYVALRAKPLLFALNLCFLVGLPWAVATYLIVDNAWGGSNSAFSIVSMIVLPLIGIAGFAYLPLLQMRRARTLQGTHTYTFSDPVIHLTGPGFDSRVDWAVLTRCYGRREGLICFTGSAPIITVPGRPLSETSREELRQLMATKGVKLAGPWRGASRPGTRTRPA